MLLLTKPTIDDMPAGATLRPGALFLWIQTPPVFGENGDERRHHRFPVYLGKDATLDQETALLAYGLLMATSPVFRSAVAELAALVRTPAARRWARKNVTFGAPVAQI